MTTDAPHAYRTRRVVCIDHTIRYNVRYVSLCATAHLCTLCVFHQRVPSAVCVSVASPLRDQFRTVNNVVAHVGDNPSAIRVVRVVSTAHEPIRTTCRITTLCVVRVVFVRVRVDACVWPNVHHGDTVVHKMRVYRAVLHPSTCRQRVPSCVVRVVHVVRVVCRAVVCVFHYVPPLCVVPLFPSPCSCNPIIPHNAHRVNDQRVQCAHVCATYFVVWAWTRARFCCMPHAHDAYHTHYTRYRRATRHTTQRIPRYVLAWKTVHTRHDTRIARARRR